MTTEIDPKSFRPINIEFLAKGTGESFDIFLSWHSPKIRINYTLLPSLTTDTREYNKIAVIVRITAIMVVPTPINAIFVINLPPSVYNWIDHIVNENPIIIKIIAGTP